MIKSKIVLLSALVSCALISGCKEENKNNVSIEFMYHRKTSARGRRRL